MTLKSVSTESASFSVFLNCLLAWYTFLASHLHIFSIILRSDDLTGHFLKWILLSLNHVLVWLLTWIRKSSCWKIQETGLHSSAKFFKCTQQSWWNVNCFSVHNYQSGPTMNKMSSSYHYHSTPLLSLRKKLRLSLYVWPVDLKAIRSLKI